ncbi:MAG: hypothetical protein KKA65_00245 [Nanoarchaeota archaeon]|nr:hypothetical protein [Nanoarchaeota archaeon]MBU4351758.1 hypothetical protein [Nanoarchaeota archaeon]MBU4455915.1 hypothetical protein [Nanoarchaeota archaeon]
MKNNIKYKAATLDERKEYYEKEFSITKAKQWFKKNNMNLPQLCALDAGSDTGIILNKKWKDKMFYFEFKDLKKKIQKYNPEDIYYDRNVYDNPKKVLDTLKFDKRIKQELTFDIDADNIKCSYSKPVCDKCLSKAYDFAINMKKELKKSGFKKIRLVYSGRGFHLHILDKKAYFLSIKERDLLNKRFNKYPIDPWVSKGNIRLIRLPYSMNGLVSRIATPVEKIYKKEKTIPKFLKLS